MPHQHHQHHQLINLNLDENKVKNVTTNGHHYCVQTVQLAVQEIINGGSSLQEVEKIFELHEEFTSLEAPVK